MAKVQGVELPRRSLFGPDVANEPEPMANNVANAGPMANSPAPDMANTPTTYRYRDTERRRAYQRELMRRRRSGAKAS